MKNFIDNKFYELIAEIDEKNLYELYNHMLSKFKQIPDATKRGIEDFFNKFPYWGRLNLSKENFEFIFNRAEVFKNNINDLVWLYEKLADYKSKFILFAILDNYYNFNFNNLKNAMEPIFKPYFDLDLIKNCQDEILVDVGAYTGDSVLDFVNSYGENCYNKIYCYEITAETVSLMKQNLSKFQNITYKNFAVGNENSKKYIKENDHSSSANLITDYGEKEIIQVSLDDDINEKITMIKMDIEGGEKEALRGCENHIKNEKPKLLISVYHNNTDLFEIPKLIFNFNPSYKFHLRYNGNCIFPTEITLICL